MRFFTLWKKSLFALLRRPTVWIFAALFLLPPLTGAFFFTEAEPAAKAENFEDQKEALTAAYEKAKEDYALLAEGEDLAQPRQKILFYETALRFELAVWSSDFLFEAASVYAEIIREWEILNAYPSEETAERKAYLESLEPRLAEILKEKDLNAFLSFLEDKMKNEQHFSEEEIKEEIEESTVRLSATLNSKMTPAKSLLVAEIRLLQKSLREGINFFDPAYEDEPLSENDRQRMETLKESYLSSLREGTFDPVPANEETLSFFESLGSFLLLCFLLALVPAAGKELAEKKSVLPCVLALFSLGAGAMILFSLSLSLSVFFFAKGSLLPSFFYVGKLFSMDFFPALLLRSLLSLVSLSPWVILALFPVKSTKIKKAKPILIGFAVLLTNLISFVTRLGGGKRAVTPFLPFVHFDLSGSFFPRFPLNLAVSPAPLFSLALVLGLSALLLFLLKRKTQGNM